MKEGQDVVMKEGEEEKKATPLPEETSDSVGPLADDSIATPSSNHKSLPASIMPPNKASTAPSQEIIDRFAPGSAPHWVGTSAFVSKEAGNDKNGSPVYVKG